LLINLSPSGNKMSQWRTAEKINAVKRLKTVFSDFTS